jgi:RNA-directed DNA polymerase
VRRIRERLAAETKALLGANAEAVIGKLNPIIRGWAAYYRTAVSSRTYAQLDHYAFKLTYKWAKRSHPNKSRHWVVDRHFGMFNSSRRDRWVFGDRDSGAYLAKFAWTKIVRHQMVKGKASPDDPALADYWAQRRSRRKPPLSTTGLRLLQAQHGRCPICGELLLHADHEPQSPDQWEQWLKVIRKAARRQAIVTSGSGTSDVIVAPSLVHAHCRRRLDTRLALLPVREPAGACLSPVRSTAHAGF